MANSVDKVKEWAVARAEIKVEFAELGITKCEICGDGNMLSFAHSKKRKDIETEDELHEVALLCIPCHQKVEILGSEKMRSKILEIISTRQERSDALKYGL